MKKTKVTLTVLATTLGLALSAPALARDDFGHRHGHRHADKHWKNHHHHADRHWSNHHHHAYRQVIRERVVVARPVYVEPYVTYAPPPPPPYYPGVAIRVDIPPLVFPLR